MKTTTVAPALKALLERFIDYAGMYPPAALALDKTVANYDNYRKGDYAWMLRFLVVGADNLASIPRSLDGSLSVLAKADEPRAASLETKSVIAASRPVYCEIAAGDFNQLDAIQEGGCFAKIRCGGVTADAIPSPFDVAAFISACANRRLPFKATAGLHHPIRATQPLTYEANAPKAVMHGFLNVLTAAAFAWHGETYLEPIVSETEASAFSFDDRAHWRDKSLSVDQIRDARENFVHSVGSCSFDEPVHDLQALGLI